MAAAETTVISVGGSLIVPDAIDSEFLGKLRAELGQCTQVGMRFVLISGGGRTSRRYAEALKAARQDATNEDLDWLGIHATRLNGHLLRAVFWEQADPVMYTHPENVPQHPEYPVTIAAGFRPGHSTDYVAVRIAQHIGAMRIVNLSNIDRVYDKDPREYPDAQPFHEIDWATFRTLIPETWDPGLSTPFDPIAAKEAEASGIEVAVVNGTNLRELSNYLAGRPFIGTRIKNGS
jgi:uridylate kinase